MTKSLAMIMNDMGKKGVNFVALQFTDLFGTLKTVEIVPSELERAVGRGYTFDGSSIEGFARIAESDMRLMPDLRTYRVMPFEENQHKIARIVCDAVTPDLEPFEIDPRTILKNAAGYALEKYNAEFFVGPELEFFLLKEGIANEAELTDEAIRRHLVDNAGYFDALSNDPAGAVRREIMLAMEEVGMVPVMSHHEVAPSQHEIGIRYQEALKMADDIILYKHLVKAIARKHCYRATFVPKLLADENGSGMHVNLNLSRNGKNIFYSPKGAHNLSDEARYFINGILLHANEIAAFTNPIPPSYERLRPGFEAPTYISWGAINRSALIRIPAVGRGEENSTRIEFRCPDPSCNPYLAFAAILHAGLDGIKKGREPPNPLNDNTYEMAEEERNKRGIRTLPESLLEALDTACGSKFIKKVFGEKFVRTYQRVKYKDVERQHNADSKGALLKTYMDV